MVEDYEGHLNSAIKPHKCYITVANIEKEQLSEDDEISTEFVFVDGKLPLWWLLRRVFEHYKL